MSSEVDAMKAIFGSETITVICSEPRRLHSRVTELVTFFHPDPEGNPDRRWEPCVGATREGRNRGGVRHDASGRLILRCYQCQQFLRFGHFDQVSRVLTEFWSRGIPTVPIYSLRKLIREGLHQ